MSGGKHWYSLLFSYCVSVFHRRKKKERAIREEVVEENAFEKFSLTRFRKGDFVAVIKKKSSHYHEIAMVMDPLWGGGPGIKVEMVKTKEIKAYLPEDLQSLGKIELKGERNDHVKCMREPKQIRRRRCSSGGKGILKRNSFVEISKDGSSLFGKKARVVNGSWGGDEAVKVMMDGTTRGFLRSDLLPLRLDSSVRLNLKDAESMRAFLIIVRYRLNHAFRHSCCRLLLRFLTDVSQIVVPRRKLPVPLSQYDDGIF